MISFDHTLSRSIAVSYLENCPHLIKKAETLGATLQIPVVTVSGAKEIDYLFIYVEKGLELHCHKRVEGRLYIDFNSSKLAYRQKFGGGIQQALARAVGIKANCRPSIIDTTAGMGQDAFILSSLGCNVCMIERSPFLAPLLEDALKRAAPNNLRLLQGNAISLLPSLTTQADTIYLDPMYPHGNKSALNKKNMRIIRELVGDDDDSGTVLQAALQYAGNRVVVKRPKGAPSLNDQKPNHVITMKNSRYDVYMCHNKSSKKKKNI